MSASAKIKVLIVDDHTMVRQALVMLLKSFDDFTVVDTAESGKAALTLCAHHKPDVVLMDLILPGMSGSDAIKAILHTNPQIKIIALTSSVDEDVIQNALKAGAAGYLLKTGSIDEVIDAMYRAYQGLPMAYPVSSISISSQPASQNYAYRLTRRQREILTLMIKGLSNREIAERMVISQSTVKNHVAHIFERLGVENRTSAVTLALNNKILGQP